MYKMIKKNLKTLLPQVFVKKLADIFGFYFDGYAQKSF